MRRKFIAGNWKMNTNRAEGAALAGAIAAKIGAASDVEVAVCPPALYLDAVGKALVVSAVGLGAQNCYHEAKGAFTGEISPQMLVDIGCKYVILGHSERRAIFKESNQDVNRKVLAALAAGLTPIMCVGETLAERQADRTAAVVREQMEGSLAGLSAEQMLKVVIAYEPVWAIGTGVVATPEQAEAVHADLRKLLETRYNSAVASSIRIQYGGSVNAENAATLLSQPNIDGALVGGASLKADSFLAIVAVAKTAGR
jgi:triosephosphate isomerase